MQDLTGFPTSFSTAAKHAPEPLERGRAVSTCFALRLCCSQPSRAFSNRSARFPFFPDADPQTWTEIIQFLYRVHYLQLIFVVKLSTDFDLLKRRFERLFFKSPCWRILTAHETRHYVACRLYKVDATLLAYFYTAAAAARPRRNFGAFIKNRLSTLPSPHR